MNQIISIPKKYNLKIVYKFLLFVSIAVLFITINYMVYFSYIKNKQSSISNSLAHSYSISKLYSPTVITGENLSSEFYPYIMGNLEIPSLSLNLPVISEMNDELLKISICRFFGPKKISSRKYMYCRT